MLAGCQQSRFGLRESLFFLNEKEVSYRRLSVIARRIVVFCLCRRRRGRCEVRRFAREAAVFGGAGIVPVLCGPFGEGHLRAFDALFAIDIGLGHLSESRRTRLRLSNLGNCGQNAPCRCHAGPALLLLILLLLLLLLGRLHRLGACEERRTWLEPGR